MIAVDLERNGTTLVARIEDNGRHFDPTQVPPSSVATSLEEAKVGDYERRDGCNRLTLRFTEPQTASQRSG